MNEYLIEPNGPVALCPPEPERIEMEMLLCFDQVRQLLDTLKAHKIQGLVFCAVPFPEDGECVVTMCGAGRILLAAAATLDEVLAIDEELRSQL